VGRLVRPKNNQTKQNKQLNKQTEKKYGQPYTTLRKRQTQKSVCCSYAGDLLVKVTQEYMCEECDNA